MRGTVTAPTAQIATSTADQAEVAPDRLTGVGGPPADPVLPPHGRLRRATPVCGVGVDSTT